jgi:hypothetical protein
MCNDYHLYNVNSNNNFCVFFIQLVIRIKFLILENMLYNKREKYVKNWRSSFCHSQFKQEKICTRFFFTCPIKLSVNVEKNRSSFVRSKVISKKDTKICSLLYNTLFGKKIVLTFLKKRHKMLKINPN